MKLGKTFFSGSLTFDEGNNSIGPNTSNITGSFTGSLKGTLTATGHILPESSEVYDLGSSDKRFRDIYLSGSTIFLGNKTLSEDNLVTTDNAAEQLAGTSIDGDFTVTGKITAQEFHTEFISASIIYQSGSTKFGDSSDDTHEFTGNVGIEVTSPAEKLEVSGSVKIGNLKIQNADGGRIGFNRNTADGTIYDSNYAAFQINGAYSGADYLDFQNYNNSGSYIGSFVFRDGNVGIGVTNPSRKLQVEGGNTYPLSLNSTQQYLLEFARGGTAEWWVAVNDGDFKLHENGVGDQFIIKAGGNVGIGTTAPDNTLHLNSASGFGGLTLQSGGTSDTGINFKTTSSGIWEIRVRNSGDRFDIYSATAFSNVLSLTSGSYVGIGTIAPSSKLDVNGSTAIGTGTQALNADAELTLRGGEEYIGLDIKSARTSGNVGGLRWYGTASDSVPVAQMLVTTDGTYGYLNGTNGAQYRLRIDPSGNVGIGTTSPSAKLHINHNNSTIALTYGNSVANSPLHTAFYGGWSGIGMDQTTAGIRLAGDISSGNPIVDMGYYSSGTVSHANWNSLMTVRQNGSVGIGTTNPGYPLHVKNSGIYHITAEQTSTDTNNNAAYATFYVLNNAGSSQLRGYFGAGGNSVGNGAMRNHVYIGAQSNHGVRFFTNDTAKMTITSGGLVGINTTAPTYVLQSESGGVASYFKGGNGGYAAVAFSGDNNSTIGVLTTWNSGIYFGRSNGSFGSAFGANGDIFIKGADGNVGIGTTSPTAKLDINGGVRYRGDIYYEHEFIASGNYTANTWYEVVDASQIPSGIYIIKCYVDLYAAGYGIYFCWYASVPFEFNNIGTNRVTYQNLPTVYGTGHAHADPPSFRITQELAGISRIQFSHIANWTGMDNTSGKAFRVYMKRIGG